MKNLLFGGAALLLVACAQKNTPSMALSSESSLGSAQIVNGRTVAANDPIARSTVALVMQIENPETGEQGGSLCTGTLVAPQVVLTAAHCVTNMVNMAVIFSTTLNGKIQDLVRPVSVATVHPLYQPEFESQHVVRSSVKFVRGSAVASKPADGSSETSAEDEELEQRFKQSVESSLGDLALVRFEGPIPAGYAPAEFLDVAKQNLKPGETVVVAGYGTTEGHFNDNPKSGAKKRKKADDTGILRTTNLKVLGPVPYSQRTLVGMDGKSTSTCSGDSGGPAYAVRNGKLYLWGVASWVTNNCQGLAVNTYVFAYTDWLNKATAALVKAK